jgi:hypothetical protein
VAAQKSVCGGARGIVARAEFAKEILAGVRKKFVSGLEDP